MNRVLKAFSCLLLLFILAGCPMMMPFMMGPMMDQRMKGSGDAQQVEKAVDDLIHEGVKSLALNRGPYDRILLGHVTVKGSFIQEGKFNQLLLNTLHSRSEWHVVDTVQGDKPLQHTQEEFQSHSQESAYSTALVNAQAYQEKELLHLSLEMADSKTRQVF